MKKQCKIFMVANDRVFGELAEATKLALAKVGYETEVVSENYKGHGDLNIVIKALRQFNHGRIKGTKVLFQLEELWNRRETGIYDLSNGFHRVLELYPENLKIPSGTQNVVFCSMGYSPAFEGTEQPAEENLDLYLYCTLTRRRHDLMSKFEPFAKEKGYTLRVANGCDWGKERDEQIIRSKIVLNVKAHDLWSYGPLHLIVAQCRKKFCLCEKTGIGYGPFKPEIHFMEFEGLQDMKDKVEYWLKHDEERNEFALNAYNDIKKNIVFDDYLLNGLKGLI